MVTITFDAIATRIAKCQDQVDILRDHPACTSVQRDELARNCNDTILQYDNAITVFEIARTDTAWAIYINQKIRAILGQGNPNAFESRQTLSLA